MSRIGKNPIFIPEGVKVNLIDNKVIIKGRLGILSQDISDEIKVIIQDSKLYLRKVREDKRTKSLHGLYRVLIDNMVKGVSKGFQKELELVGIGYRVSHYKEDILEFNLGFSHKIMMEIPKEICIETKVEKGKNPILILRSYDKQLLGMIAAKIRSFRKPEPYKGKGIRYVKEKVRRKEGKSA
ncbi:MAG: 50S ribosomal protein L6 [Flavobacteriales bacterium]|jgi:large subunit ribosomal protein L6|uniref:50S ribosomal protein L6 n=1 Tax=Blattabacterium sp. (Mastotermes darwiniensis) TaxID=39768 RepID=UPI000231DE64|nr:50S ribosomal protein L6 [Blattabacterium sp. (Mastotermes darwiniensis)]AER40664.1 50S ribosomal protein L6 [Blattabacterium sp. (Mastotermes darwiniensis) str. MADAR]MDR1804808.1 50S ribosomal protein L6 [Flavobacteriales bacterium]